MYEIMISKVSNGLIIRAGCMTFVSTDPAKAIGKIMEYFTTDNPGEIEKEMLVKYGGGNQNDVHTARLNRECEAQTAFQRVSKGGV